MQIDLGILRFALPTDGDPILPHMLVALGVEDQQQSLGVGPTLAKTQSHKFRRTTTVALGPKLPEHSPQQALEAAVNSIVRRAAGKVVTSADRAVAKSPGKVVEVRHAGPDKVPLRSLVMVRCADDWVQTVMLTALDTRDNDAAVRGQFEMLLDSVRAGSFFQDG